MFYSDYKISTLGTCSAANIFQPGDSPGPYLLFCNSNQSLMCHFLLLDDWGSHYEYIGCYMDRHWLDGRALKGHSEDLDHNTLKQCTSVCLNQNQGDTIIIYK